MQVATVQSIPHDETLYLFQSLYIPPSSAFAYFRLVATVSKSTISQQRTSDCEPISGLGALLP